MFPNFSKVKYVVLNEGKTASLKYVDSFNKVPETTILSTLNLISVFRGALFPAVWPEARFVLW